MSSSHEIAGYVTNENGSKLSSTLGDDALGHRKQPPASGLARVSKLLHTASSHKKQGTGPKVSSQPAFGRRSSLGYTPSYGPPSITVERAQASELPSDKEAPFSNLQAFPSGTNPATTAGDLVDEPSAIERRRSARSTVGHIDYTDPAFRARAESNPYLADTRFSFSTPSLIFSSSKAKVPRMDAPHPASFYPGLDAYYFAPNSLPKPASSSKSKGKTVSSTVAKSGAPGRLSVDRSRIDIDDEGDVYAEDHNDLIGGAGWPPESDINNAIHSWETSATKPLQRSSSTRHSSATASGTRASRMRKNSLHAPRDDKDKTWTHTAAAAGTTKRTAVASSGPGVDMPLHGGGNGTFTLSAGFGLPGVLYMAPNNSSSGDTGAGSALDSGEVVPSIVEAVHATNVRPDGDKRPSPSKSFSWKNNKRHHAFPSSKAPYPRSYDYQAIDYDITDHLFLTTLCNSLTWHDFAPTPVEPKSIPPETKVNPQATGNSSTATGPSVDEAIVPNDPPKPAVFEHPTTARPKRILDLGCGSGAWVMDAAKVWTDARFVGLDLVPIQPNLSIVAPQLKDRIEWVNANFLEPLPFPTSHFDFVHIRRIARGVPENKWDAVLEEVSRVLKPDGALEIFEEDLIFPGGSEQCTCHYPPDRVGEEESFDDTRRGSSESQQQPVDHYMSPPDTPMGFPTSTTTSTAPAPSLFSPLSDSEAVNKSVPPGASSRYPASGGLFYDASQSVSVHDHRRLEQMYNDMHQDKFINLTPISVLTSILPLYFRDVRSHPPVLLTFPPAEETMWSDTSSSASESDTGVGGLISAENDDPTKESRKKRRICRSTLRKSRPSTANSSLGSSAFGSSFGGSPKQSRLSMEQQLEEMPDESEAHDTTSPIPTTTKTSTEPRGYMHHPPPGGWHTLHLDIHQLVHPKQPFIMIDRCRIPAITPSHLSSHNDTNLQSDKENRTESAIRLMTRLPNLTFNMDLQALTSSLGRSVTEVVECKEAIWDYMVQTGQAKSTDGAVYGFGMGVGMSLAGTPGAATAVRSAVAAAPTSNSSTQPSVSSAPVSPRVRPNNIKVHDSIVDRDEFDMWITRYERDMHGRIQMAKALTRRLDWKPRGLSSADHAPSANTHRHAPSASSGARDVISPTNGPPLTVTGTVYVPRPQPGMDITDNHVPSSVGTSTSQPQGFSSSSEEVGTGIAPMTRMDLSSTSLLEEEDAIGGESQPPLNIRQRTGSAPEKMTPNTSVGSKSSTIPQPHAHRHHPGHSRAQSLDAVNAWELLAQENSHLGSFLSGQKPTAADATKSSLERWEDELPKLSRCVKVFVAWNNKTE